MFMKDDLSDESYIHVCNDKTKKQMLNKGIEIRLHDVSIFTIVYDEDGRNKLEHIKFCPYCGCNLENDAFENL